MVRLFDVQNGKPIPSEHCYTTETLSIIMKAYPEEYMRVYAYIFYMTCPNPDLNPFFDVPTEDKEELIRKEVGGEFDAEDYDIQDAIKFCEKLYETPTVRAYNGIRTMLDRLAKYMETTQIEHGRDGNITALINAAKNFESIRQSFKGTLRDLQEEQSTSVRGGQRLAYDS